MPREIVTSRANPLIKRLRALLAGAAAEGVAVLEGFKLVEEALSAGLQIPDVALTPHALERHAALAARLEERGAALRIVTSSVLDALSEASASQGLLAIAGRPVFDEDAMFHGVPLIVVAAGIQNPGNLGALLRTAEAAGATGAYVTADSADTMSWKALRGAMGSAFRLPHVTGIGAEEAMARLARRRVRTVAALAGASERYDAFDFTGPVALLFGNEGAGLPAVIASRADARVRIPIAPAVESLNVGVAAGILLFEAARQRRR